jgi:2-C-methyl-D-erythritol 4-phosphate cytidylyltransferase
MPSDPTSPVRLHALVPCAGSGVRAGSAGAKQYVEIAGRTMVAHTLAALVAVRRLERILVVLARDDRRFAALTDVPADPRLAVAHRGGATRALTVAAGLDELARLGAAADDWVLVHDAARCLVRAEWVDALVDACIDDPVGGLLALPVSDTLKREAGGRVAATVPRQGMWQAQTPQMFRLGVLSEALARADESATDEASAIEAMGLAPKLVACSAENFKVTHASDFPIAAALFEARAA